MRRPDMRLHTCSEGNPRPLSQDFGGPVAAEPPRVSKGLVLRSLERGFGGNPIGKKGLYESG